MKEVAVSSVSVGQCQEEEEEEEGEEEEETYISCYSETIVETWSSCNHFKLITSVLEPSQTQR